MTGFSEDLVKIVLDKVLLGGVAVGVALYLNRLLEQRRAENAYTHALILQRAETCRSLASFLHEHHNAIVGVHEMLETISKKREAGIDLSEDDAKAGFSYIARQDSFRSTMMQLAVNMPPVVLIALTNYLRESNKLFARIRGDANAAHPFPTRETLDSQAERVFMACAFATSLNPFKATDDGARKTFRTITGMWPEEVEEKYRES